MVPLKQIKKGIQTGDWTLVTEGYNALTGDDLSVPSSSQTSMTLPDIIAALQQLAGSDTIDEVVDESVPITPAKPKKTRKKNSKPEISKDFVESLANINAEIDVSRAPTGVPDTSTGSGSKQVISTKVIPFSPDAIDPDKQKSNAKLATNKNYRDPYQPNLITCHSCDNDFDGNKHESGRIIGGKAGDGTVKYKCPHCKETMIE